MIAESLLRTQITLLFKTVEQDHKELPGPTHHMFALISRKKYHKKINKRSSESPESSFRKG